MKRFRIPKFSIFMKLILIVLLFGAVIDVAVLVVIRISTSHEPGPMRRAERILINEIGTPPDTVKAKQYCKEMGWRIRYLSPAFKWASSDSVPTLDELNKSDEFLEKLHNDDRFIFFYNSKPHLIYKTPNELYIIQLLAPRDDFDEQQAIISLVVLLSIIIITFYYIVRKLFTPLKQLSTAVQQVGEGNYYLKIPVQRNDELGELAQSISSMASKIGDSIKAKEQLLLDVSHELRTPLTRIKLGLEVDSSKEKINEDVNEMERMISGLLDSYRTENSVGNLKLAKTDITEVLEDIIEEYESGDRLKFLTPNKRETIIADEEKIQAVFRNIIENALKYSEGNIEIKIESDDKTVTVSIRDRGVGIAEKDLPYIFEPFYRADHSRTRTTGGFGLGLSICKKIMDAHKAAIVVNSKPGEGSEFRLVFNKQL